MTAESQLASFIAKFDPKHQTILRSARRILRARFPTANEIVYDNYNFFVIGYSPTMRPSDTVVSLTGGASGIGLSFYHGATLPDPHKLLLGSGVQNRFIRLDSAKRLTTPDVEALIAAAASQSKTPFPRSGTGALVIKSISEKQRQRRKAKP
ncbi:MAG TPA: hypothetical protein VHB25_05550 [Gemmatimonadaceae bacterium]|nr:hypothetical protein [Gemmatimonadaceae bacterium]